MKLLLFSDLHADLAAAKSLAQTAAAQDVAVLIGAGDFGNLRKNYEPCVEALIAVGKPFIMVGGNNESADQLAAICAGRSQVYVLHGSSYTIGGIEFFGLGGGVPPTPFGAWSWDFTEAEAAELLASAPRGCVLITHSPPKGMVDRSSSGASLGSTAVRDAINRLQPKLVICGHIHGSAGKQATQGPTTVINAGPQGIVVEL